MSQHDSTRPSTHPTTSPTTSPPMGGTSRRHFIQATTAFAAAGTLAGGLNIARAAHAAGDDEIKVALIGCGGRGTGAASQALATKGKVTLWAIADAFEDNVERCLKSLEVGGQRDTRQNSTQNSRLDVPPERRFTGFDAYQRAIDSGVDMVILATPPGFRPIHFEAAVKAGKHIFTEKPLAVDAPGIHQVLAAAEESKKKGLCVGVGLQRRHQAPYVETIQRLRDGVIGDIVLTRVYWNGGGVWVRGRKPGQTEMEYQMRNWYYFTWLCGDHIVEQHIHNLDVSNWLKGGPPKMARGMGGRQVRTGKDHGQIYDHFAVEFTYEDGTTMMSQCRHIRNCWNQVTEYAASTKGTAHIGGGSYQTGGEKWQYDGPSPNPYQKEHDDLFAAIRAGQAYNETEYGATSTMTAILGRMATYSGKELSWDAAINSKVDLSPSEYSFDAEPPVMPNSKGKYPIPMPGQYKAV